jgi:hypothetical protein
MLTEAHTPGSETRDFIVHSRADRVMFMLIFLPPKSHKGDVEGDPGGCCAHNRSVSQLRLFLIGRLLANLS